MWKMTPKLAVAALMAAASVTTLSHAYAQKQENRPATQQTKEQMRETPNEEGKRTRTSSGETAKEPRARADGNRRSGDATKKVEKTHQSREGSDDQDRSKKRADTHKDGDDKHAVIKRRAKSLKRGKRHADFKIRVGVDIPRSITLYTVPAFIVDLYPSYRRYRYYYDGDVVVIVNPANHRIVDVIYL